MTAKERIELIKKRVVVNRFPISIDKFKITMRVRAETRNDPVIIQRGKVLKAVASEMPLFISEGELIVGSGSSKPMGIEIDPDYGIWLDDEIQALKDEGFIVDPEDEAELQILNKSHSPVTMIGKEGDIFYEENGRIMKMLKAGLVLPPWKDKEVERGVGGGYAQSGFGLGPSLYLMGVDFKKALTLGTDEIIRQAYEYRQAIRFVDADAPEKFYYYSAVADSFEAINILARRYSALASEMAKTEKDAVRRRELSQISETCAWVPMNPPRTFREAIQSFWFYFLMMNPDTTIPGGRFDQLVGKYYDKDLKAGRITRDEAVELLALLRLKDMELNRISGSQLRKKNSGMAKWHNWTIGGVDPVTGEDVTNEVSYMLLDAAVATMVPHHTITIRVHPGTPEKLMLKGLETVKAGLGMPAFVGDGSYINTLTARGVPTELARDYFLSGCLDVGLPGAARVGPCPMVTMPLIFDIFRHNGVDVKTGLEVGLHTGDFTKFESFDELFKAMYQQFDYILHLVGEKNNVEWYVTQKFLPDPIRSALCWRGLEDGKEMFSKVMPFENGSCICPIGTINVADSLTAIKKLVFDSKKYTLQELYDALEADWVGYEAMRKDFLEAPKYGNNDPYADDQAVACYKMLGDIGKTIPNLFGTETFFTGVSITSYQPGGQLTGATPDGRKAGTILADGSMSPMQGCDHCGPTAVFSSAMKINQDPFTATLMNMKFHTSACKTEADLKKLASMIKIYLTNGGKHVQFNIVDQSTLIAAQKEPEKYRDLVVRVAGYSTYFVMLSKEVQADLIKRSSLDLS